MGVAWERGLAQGEKRISENGLGISVRSAERIVESRKNLCVFVDTHMRMYPCVDTHTHAPKRTNAHTQTFPHTHTRKRSHIHTQTHTRSHTYKNTQLKMYSNIYDRKAMRKQTFNLHNGKIMGTQM